MSRRFIVLFIAIFFGMAMAAWAGNVHFVGTTSTTTGSFHLQGTAAGLGNGSYTFTLTAYGNVIALCQNNGGNIAPGRNPISISSSSSDTFVSDANGTASIVLHAPDPTFVTPAPVSPTPKEAGCPSATWTVIGLQEGSTLWTNASVTAVNNTGGALELEEAWTCSGTAESCVQNEN